jgi:heptosyltransferase-1
MRFLVLRFGPIGDLLRLLPLFHALKAASPENRLAWVTDASALGGLLDGHPDVDRRLDFPVRGMRIRERLAFLREIRAESYDAALDLQGNFRSAALMGLSRAGRKIGTDRRKEMARLFHRETIPARNLRWWQRLEAVCAHLGVSWRTDWRLPLPEAARSFAEDFYRRSGLEGSPVIFFFPGSRASRKHGDRRRWPERNFVELGKNLRRETGARLLVGHGPGEEPLARRIAGGIGEGAIAAPPARLPETAALVARSSLYAGNDTGITHLAWLLRVPAVFLYRVYTNQSPPPHWNLPVAEARVPAGMPDAESVRVAAEAVMSLWPLRLARR